MLATVNIETITRPPWSTWGGLFHASMARRLRCRGDGIPWTQRPALGFPGRLNARRRDRPVTRAPGIMQGRFMADLPALLAIRRGVNSRGPPEALRRLCRFCDAVFMSIRAKRCKTVQRAKTGKG